ncbi:MAG: sigma-70 region 4 domain-containing protein, partial [Phaeodactylibacter sp.]|nr:sigma-70 region 4 domain-containing protein [Phaeodactylibacter sp.]
DAQYTWFQQLSSRDQALLELRLQGFPQQEIAEYFGLSYGTVRNRSRALVKKACRLAKLAG